MEWESALEIISREKVKSFDLGERVGERDGGSVSMFGSYSSISWSISDFRGENSY